MNLTKSKIAAALLPMGILAIGNYFVSRPASAADPSVGVTADEQRVAEFRQLHQKLVKMSTERVWSIPWQVSVREARELAAKENKPLMLWCTNNGGTNPLGPC